MRRNFMGLNKARAYLAKTGAVLAVGAALTGCDGAALTDENGNPKTITIEITAGNASSNSPASSSLGNASSAIITSTQSTSSSSVLTSAISSVSVSQAESTVSSTTSAAVSSDDYMLPSSSSSEFSAGSSVPNASSVSSGGVWDIYPETPSRLSLEYSLPTSWNFTIDDIVSDPFEGKAYVIDRELSKLHKLDLLTGSTDAMQTIADDSYALDLLASEQLLATISRSEATLSLYNTADLSLIDSIELDDVPHDVAIAANGLVAISFETGVAQIVLFDAVANTFLSSLAAPLNSQLTVVGNQLFAYSANEPQSLRSFILDASGIITSSEQQYPAGTLLGGIAAGSENSTLIITENGHLIDRTSLAVVDVTDYGQQTFKDAAFLMDARYAVSIDERNYIRLFDAQSQPQDYGVSNDSRRIGSVSSFQAGSNIPTAVAVYDDTAFVIHEGSWSTDATYSLTQLVLSPYLTLERRLAEFEYGSSSVSSGGNGNSTSSFESVITSSSERSEPTSSVSSTSNVISSSSSSVEVSSSDEQASSSESQYPAIMLSIRPTSEVEQKWVDKDKGIAYLRINSGGYQHIRALDLRTGFLGETLGLHSRFSVQALTISPDFDAVWSFTPDGSDGIQGGRLFKHDIRDGNALEAVSFEVGHDVSEIIVTQWSVFTLNDTRDVIYQHNPNNGAVYHELAVNPVDELLYLPGSDTLYLKSAGVVTEYGLDGRVIYPTGFAVNFGQSREGFGFVNLDETRLYRSQCEVRELPSFEELDICGSVDARIGFIDIAFGDADTHYSIESYFEGEGDVYKTALQNYEATQLPLKGHHIFKTAAGVHVYHVENGEHKLYQIEGPEAVKESFSTHEPRAEETLVGRVPYAKHFYWDMEFYANFWSNPVLSVDLPSFEGSAGAQIVIEPICAIEGCVTGQYIQSLPASSARAQFIISLESFFTIHDIRYFEGFMVRTDGAFSSDKESPFTLPQNSLLARGDDCSRFGGRFEHVFCAL